MKIFSLENFVVHAKPYGYTDHACMYLVYCCGWFCKMFTDLSSDLRKLKVASYQVIVFTVAELQ